MRKSGLGSRIETQRLIRWRQTIRFSESSQTVLSPQSCCWFREAIRTILTSLPATSIDQRPDHGTSEAVGCDRTRPDGARHGADNQ